MRQYTHRSLVTAGRITAVRDSVVYGTRGYTEQNNLFSMSDSGIGQHMEKAVIDVLTYCSFFSYAPSFEEIYTVFQIKITRQELRRQLSLMVKRGLLLKRSLSLPTLFSRKAVRIRTPPCGGSHSTGNFQFSIFNFPIYTLPPHRIFFDKRVDRARISRKKIERALPFIQLLGTIPFVRMIGISGGVSMMNAGYADDIDFFIIASAGRLWMTRICLLAGAEFFGLRRKRHSHRVKDMFCFNLFFEETDLTVPKEKQNLYRAHEMVQMRPIIVKNEAYGRFLAANQWVARFFPNSHRLNSVQNTALYGENSYSEQHTNRSKKYKRNTNYIGDVIEFLCKKIQLFVMERHRTRERITDTQLWFFPRDFEKKLKKKNVI